MLFTPFYLPMVGLIILFIFTYMAILPLGYKLYMLMFIYMFTVLMPSLLIHLYRKFQGWSPIELGHKETGISPCPTRVEHRAHRRSFGADGVRFHQYMVEDIHAHSGYRRYGGSIAGLRRKIRFQSHLVALPDAHHSGHGGKQPHDIAPTLPGAGGSGLLRGPALRIPYYIIEEKTNIT